MHWITPLGSATCSTQEQVFQEIARDPQALTEIDSPNVEALPFVGNKLLALARAITVWILDLLLLPLLLLPDDEPLFSISNVCCLCGRFGCYVNFLVCNVGRLLSCVSYLVNSLSLEVVLEAKFC